MRAFPVIPTTGSIPTFVAYPAVHYLRVLLHVRFGPKPILKVAPAPRARRPAR